MPKYTRSRPRCFADGGRHDSLAGTLLLKGEQSNTSIVYGDRLILKFFRRVGEGLNPDVEVGRFITEKTSFAHVPPLAGVSGNAQGTRRTRHTRNSPGTGGKPRRCLALYSG